MAKKTILHIIPRFTTGGAEKLVLSYAKYFSKEYRIAVASVVGGGELVEHFKSLGAEVFVAPEKHITRLKKTNDSLLKFARDINPDIIHSHIFSGDIVAHRLKEKLEKVRWISTQHNVHDEYGKFRRGIIKRSLKKADEVIAVSSAVKKSCREVFKIPEDKVIVIKNGIDLNPWLAVPETELFATDTIHIAIVGRVEQQKAHDILLKSLATIRGMAWQLHVFGTGSLQEGFKALSEELGIDNNVTWHGVVNDLPTAFSTVDVVLQPSRWEGMSLSVMEAMAAGRFVITSEQAGQDLVKHKKTGLVVPAEDITALAQAILYAYESRDSAKAMAKAARIHAKKNFSEEHHLQSLEKVYQACL